MIVMKNSTIMLRRVQTAFPADWTGFCQIALDGAASVPSPSTYGIVASAVRGL